VKWHRQRNGSISLTSKSEISQNTIEVKMKAAANGSLAKNIVKKMTAAVISKKL
jgi:hypothetical protein